MLWLRGHEKGLALGVQMVFEMQGPCRENLQLSVSIVEARRRGWQYNELSFPQPHPALRGSRFYFLDRYPELNHHIVDP